MDKKDRILLRVLTILFALFVLLLALYGWQLGQNVEKQASHYQAQIDTIYEDLDLQREELNTLKSQFKHFIENPPKDGEKGDDGVSIKGEDGEDGVTTIERHETQTIIEKPVVIEPEPGRDGRTPEFAIDATTGSQLMRYKGDEDWHLVPRVVCSVLSVVCRAE